jgi:hypothetical protein
MNHLVLCGQYPYRKLSWNSHDQFPIISVLSLKFMMMRFLITDGTGMTGVVNKFQRILN